MSRYRQTMTEALKQVNETTYGWTIVSKAKDIAKKFKDNMTKAVAEIEKLEKGLSKNPTVDAELRKYNENLDEASLKDIFTANQEGKKVEDIAKKLKMSVADVKKILGEEIGEISEENLEEFTSDMIKRLKKSYSTMPQKLSTDQANALSRHLDRLDLTSLKKLSKENIPFLTTLARNKIYKKTGKFEDVNEEDGKIGPAGKIALAKEKDTDGLEKQLTAAQGQIELLKQKIENEKNKAIKPVPNPETGEVPLTIGIANKLLKDKDEKEAKEKKQKENSEKIKSLAKGEKLESFTRKYLQHLNITESEAGDKAKGMGLTYMKFGRYGKDGTVTHKSIGGNLTAVGKDEKPIKEPTKKSDEPKKGEPPADDKVDINIKSKNFLKDLENGNLENDDGEIEMNFDDEGYVDSVVNKASEMGLDDLASDLEDVQGYVQDYEPEKAEAAYQDIIAKYSGKPVAAVEFSKQADEAITTIADQTYTDNPAPFADDLLPVLSIMKKMADSDESQGDRGSGMSNPKKGFRPEVLDTIQSVGDIVDHAAQLEDEYKGKNTKVKGILADIQAELNFIEDENADHDNYTKPHRVNDSINRAIELTRDLQKEMKKESKEAKKKQVKEEKRLYIESIIKKSRIKK